MLYWHFSEPYVGYLIADHIQLRTLTELLVPFKLPLLILHRLLLRKSSQTFKLNKKHQDKKNLCWIPLLELETMLSNPNFSSRTLSIKRLLKAVYLPKASVKNGVAFLQAMLGLVLGKYQFPL